MTTRIEEILQANQGVAFVGLFLIFAILEAIFRSDRDREDRDMARLATNFGLQLSQGVLLLAVPVGLSGIVLLSAEAGPRLLRLWELPPWLVPIVLILLRTLLAYWLHRLEHGWPLLWRYHRVHHSDPRVDLTTSLRQHPVALLPMLLSQGALLFLLGPPLWAYLLSELPLLANQLWQHANVKRRAPTARALGSVFVTPENHLVHHSASRRQTDSNFGVLLIVWDRLFGTYVPPGTAEMRLGLGPADDAVAGNFLKQLWVPFSRLAESRGEATTD